MTNYTDNLQTTISNPHRGMELLTVEKPDLSTINRGEVLSKLVNNTNINNYIKISNEPDYLYWTKVKYKTPPPGLTNIEFWFMLKQIRQFLSIPTPIKAQNGKLFTWVRTPGVDEYLHKIDRYTGGQVFAPYEALMGQTKQKFVSRGIIEEAIASSQLEGATTTSPVAKKLILENRVPRNASEIMITNNYRTMRLIDEDYKNRNLTEALLFEIHKQLTKDQAESTEQLRYRKNSDDIIVGNATHIAHIPPNEEFLKQEMVNFFQYANDEDSAGFIHPVIKAIFIHFWIGYLHPFTDGNGRLARGLFYWYLLKKGYWTFAYLPISTIIRKSPDSYAKSYLWTEQDDLDLTYFFDYNIHKVLQAITEFNNYLDKVVIENHEIDHLLGKDLTLNERQKQTIHHLLAEGEHAYVTTSTQMIINRVGRLTARKDLIELEKNELLYAKKVGKIVRFYPTEKLFSLNKH